MLVDFEAFLSPVPPSPPMDVTPDRVPGSAHTRRLGTRFAAVRPRCGWPTLQGGCCTGMMLCVWVLSCACGIQTFLPPLPLVWHSGLHSIGALANTSTHLRRLEPHYQVGEVAVSLCGFHPPRTLIPPPPPGHLTLLEAGTGCTACTLLVTPGWYGGIKRLLWREPLTLPPQPPFYAAGRSRNTRYIGGAMLLRCRVGCSFATCCG